MRWNEFCNNLKEVLELERHVNENYMRWKMNNTDILIEYYFEQDKIIKFTYNKKQFDIDYKNIKEGNELKISNEKYNEVPISFKSA